MFKRSVIKTCLLATILVGSSLPAKNLVVGASEWPPFESEMAEEYGVYTKMLTKVINEMGYEPVYEFMPWKRNYEMVKRGVIPSSFAWYYTKERSEEIFYPKHHLATADDVVWYKKSKFPDGLKIGNYEDIKEQNLKVVGINSYYYVKPLQELEIDLHLVSKPDLSWKFLDRDKADVIIQNDIVGGEEIKEALGKEKVEDYAHTDPISSEKVFILFSRAHPDGSKLKDEFDAAYEKLKKAGEI